VAVLDLNGIKTQLKSIFEAANTTTASVPLSTGLETVVQKVLTVNPARIPIQSTWYPYVTVFIDGKLPHEVTINRSQTNGTRRAEVDIKIVGAVWNSTVTDETADDASDDCESLMENIEQILRANSSIGGKVNWSFPTGITYHNLRLEEESSIRAGIMSLKAVAHY
jgi:hypothetical protein